MTTKNTKIRIAKGARKRGPFATIDEAIAAIQRRPHDHRRRRRGSRERGRPDDGGVEGDAGGDQLHGEARPRADLPGDDARAARPARDPARGDRQLLAVATRRSACRSMPATARRTGISAADRARTVRAAIAPETKPRDLARPGHVFPLRARSGGVLVARRSHRSRGRPGAHCRPRAGRRHLRNHERGRHDGARAGADEVRQEARSADDHHRGPDSVPHAHGAAGEARGDRRAADRARRLPHLRLREPAR